MNDIDASSDNDSNHLADWNGEPLVVVFFIALEHPLMIAEGLTTFAQRNSESVPWVEFPGGYNFVAIRIWRREVERLFDYKYAFTAFKLAHELVFKEPIGEPVEPFGSVPWPTSTYMGSIVEIATPLLQTEDFDTNHAVSDAFDRCIEEFQIFSLAYQSVTKDRRLRPVTRQTCPQIVPFCFQRKDNADLFGLSSMLVHEGNSMPFEPEELTAEQQRKFEVAWSRRRSDDPFATYVDWSRKARRSLNIDGDYAQTVIATYTAIEFLFSNVLLMCAWEAQQERKSVREWFEDGTGFLARTRKNLQPLLGGNWVDQSTESFTSKIRAVGNIRHIIVHQGRIPNEQAAKYALVLKDELEEMLKNCLAAKRLDYPRTCLMLLGTPGLERRNLWSGKIQKWSDIYADKEPPYTSWFRSWLDLQEGDERCPIPPVKLKERPEFA